MPHTKFRKKKERKTVIYIVIRTFEKDGDWR